MEEVNFILAKKKRSGENPDFLDFMEEVDKRFKDMDMLWILSEIRDSLKEKKIKSEPRKMQSGYN